MVNTLLTGAPGDAGSAGDGKFEGAPSHSIIVTRPTLFEHGILPVLTAMPNATQLCEIVQRFDSESVKTMGISAWQKIAKEMIKMDTGFAQLVFDMFLDCTTSEVVGDVTEVNIVEFAVYLLLLANSKEEIGIGGSPRTLRADIAYPQLSTPTECALSPRSQPKSPRTVLASGGKLAEMERRQIAFLHKHGRELLLICAGAATATRISAKQFDALSVILMAPHPHSAEPPSSIAPFWRSGGQDSVAISDVLAWMTDSLPLMEGPLASPGGRISPPHSWLHDSTQQHGMQIDRNNAAVIANLCKATVIRSATDLAGRGREAAEETVRLSVRVQCCSDCYIYITAPVARVAICGCHHCTVFVAGAALVTVDHCERLQVTVGCKRLRVASCVDSTLQILTNRQPVVIGDNHDLLLAPFNALFCDCLSFWLQLNIDRTKNRWAEPLSVSRTTSSVVLSGGAVPGQSLMPPSDFFCVTIPSATPQSASLVASQANPCPLPPAYATALQSKHRQVLDLRKGIAETETMLPNTKPALQRAIQAKFKEWLVASGNMRQVSDLVHMEHSYPHSIHHDTILMPSDVPRPGA